MTDTDLLADLTSQEKMLLAWLAKEDRSQYGECSGQPLTVLINRGFVRPDCWPCSDFDWVRLTELGERLAALDREIPMSADTDRETAERIAMLTGFRVIADAITAALSAAREEERERAAKVSDDIALRAAESAQTVSLVELHHYLHGKRHAAIEAAAAIRALKDKP